MATAEQIAVVEAEHLEVDCRLDVLNRDNEYVDDITEAFEDGEVEHRNFRTIHRTITGRLGKELPWGQFRVRPTMTLSAAGTTIEQPLGVFALTAPRYPRGETPRTYDVAGFDLLYLLDHYIDRTVIINVAEDVITQIERLLEERGLPDHRIDASASGKTLSSPLIVPAAEQRTWLSIVNELLAALGYRSLAMSPDGVPESGPYLSPSETSPMWTYDLGSPTTNVSDDAVLADDYTDTPNVWVVFRDDPSLGVPTELNGGLVRLVNQDTGPASINKRAGLAIVRSEAVEAVDTDALMAIALRFKAEDQAGLRHLEMTTGPNPFHGHFDVVDVVDPQGVAHGRWQHLAWRLPLFGGDMTHEWRSVG